MTISPFAPLQLPGPAQSAWLIHFCGRPAGTGISSSVPHEITAMTPAERLDNILWQAFIGAFVPYQATKPMVCLSESPWAHLQWLIGTRGFLPWGVFLSRQWVYDVGGAPVWYVRPEQAAGVNPAFQSWTVRLETTPSSRSDWLHEREWRLPPFEGTGGVSLLPGSVMAVLVGDPAWQPSSRGWPPDPRRLINSQTGMEAWPGDPLAVPDPRPVAAVHPFWGHVPVVSWVPETGSFAYV